MILYHDMEGVILYQQPETILEQDDVETKQISKGRGAFLCETNHGMKILAAFCGSKEKGLFLSGVLQELKENGYPAEQILRAKDGSCVVQDESGMRYWLKDYKEGSECSAVRESDILAGVHEIAAFHAAVRRCSLQIPEFMKKEKNSLQLLYSRHFKELILLKNYVRSRKKKNAFESRFRELYPHFIAQAKEALDQLNGQEEAFDEMLLCHGDCNQHNILHTAEGFCLINFENMFWGKQVVDLVNFLRKMMEKNSWSIQLGRSILEEYDKVVNLTEGDRKLIYILLLFPEKFWKISNHYSNSHKAWVSGRDIEKLEKLSEMEPARVRFLENVFSF